MEDIIKKAELIEQRLKEMKEEVEAWTRITEECVKELDYTIEKIRHVQAQSNKLLNDEMKKQVESWTDVSEDSMEELHEALEILKNELNR